MQKAIVVNYYNDKKNNLSELNQHLEEGWKVVSQSASQAVRWVQQFIHLLY